MTRPQPLDRNLRLALLTSLAAQKLVDIPLEDLSQRHRLRGHTRQLQNEALSRALLAIPIESHLAALRTLEWTVTDPVLQAVATALWDGEDDLFSIQSLAGIERCVSLERVVIERLLADRVDLRPLEQLPALRYLELRPGELTLAQVAVLDALEARGVKLSLGRDARGEARRAAERREREQAARRAERKAEAGAKARAPALEEAILADIDRDEPFVAYGEWLAAKGNPHGELVLLEAKLGAGDKTLKKRVERLREKLSPTLVGDLWAHTGAAYRWRCGFIDGVYLSFTMATAERLARVLALPVARFVREVELAYAPGYGDLVATLARANPAPRLARFIIGAIEPGNEPEAPAGDLSPLLATYPRLRELTVCATDLAFSAPIDLPDARVVGLKPETLSADAATALASATWPALERLTLWVGPDARAPGGPPFSTLAPLLTGERTPALRHLALCRTPWTDELLDALLASPLLPRLETLDLCDGELTDAGAERLLARAADLSGLTKLDVSRNRLSEAAVTSLSKVFKKRVEAFAQRRKGK